jgi:hypothetical protein
MKFKSSMTLKTRIHDGIIGAMVLAGTWLGLMHSTVWYYATTALACLMISSSFTKFCPVYYALDRIMSEDQPK